MLGKCSAIFSPCIRCLEQCSRRLLIYVCIMSVCFSGHWSWMWLQVGTFSYLNFSIQKIFSLSLFHLQNDHLNRIISIIKLVLGTNTLTTRPYRHVHNTDMLNTLHYEHFPCSQRKLEFIWSIPLKSGTSTIRTLCSGPFMHQCAGMEEHSLNCEVEFTSARVIGANL